MPELPEVEAARVLARRVALGRRITRVGCAGDPIVFEAGRPAQVRRALLGRRVRGVGRHGKHLWLELDRRPWPCFHFGMAGGFHAPRARAVRLVSAGKRETGDAWPPPFAKLRLTFDDGGELVMTDARRLGRIRLRADPRAEPPVSELGFDALLGLPAPPRFADLLAGRSAPIKALLLDQSFAAGVGNWIADEVLYQARIAPRRPGRSSPPRLPRGRTAIASRGSGSFTIVGAVMREPSPPAASGSATTRSRGGRRRGCPPSSANQSKGPRRPPSSIPQDAV